MKIEVIFADGTQKSDNGEVGWWRKEVINSKQKIKTLLVNGNPFQPNADGYFMLFNCIAFVQGGEQFHSKGVGYIKENTRRARVVWLNPDGNLLAEVMKPIPDFIREIAVEREKDPPQ